MLTAPEHQTQAVLTVLGVYPIISSFVQAAVQPFVTDVSNTAWSIHPSAPLTPAEAALAKLRNAPTTLSMTDEARKSGTDSERFAVMEYITGEPPGIEQLLELYRRDELSRDDLLKGVRQSRVRDEWFNAVLALRFAPPSPLEVIAGAVKGHLDDGTARTYAEQGGLAPKHFDWVRATAGRPPGTVEMLELLNRGEITEADFAAAVRQSDIQDRWIPELLALRRYVPPVRSIPVMLRHGSITDARATELLKDHGVTDADIPLYLAEGHAAKVEHIKHLALGEVRSLYHARMISHADATLDIEALGYTTQEAAQMLALVDSARARRYQEAAVSRVHALYVTHRIDVTEAQLDLDRMGVDPAERDELLRLWRLETQANVRILTLAQVQGAWRRSVMTTAEASRRIVELGYHADDVPSLLALAISPTHFTQRTPKDLP
jgi:hypothetical protein